MADVVSSARYVDRTAAVWPARPVASHPQLRAVICVQDEDRVLAASDRGVEELNMATGSRSTVFTFKHRPCSISLGEGYLVAGGQNSELSVRKLDAEPETSDAWSRANFRVGSSIVNAVTILPSSEAAATLICASNDLSFHVVDLTGPRIGDDLDEDKQMLPAIHRRKRVRMPVPVNATAVSPDGRWLVAIGDSPLVWLYAVKNLSFELVATLVGGEAESSCLFGVSFAPDSRTFAVSAQDGVVTVFDLRQAASGQRTAGRSTEIARFRTKQYGRGHIGAARVVKFSPGPEKLLAFTEQRGYATVVDARTLDADQAMRLEIPAVSAWQAEQTWRSPPRYAPTASNDGVRYQPTSLVEAIALSERALSPADWPPICPDLDMLTPSEPSSPRGGIGLAGELTGLDWSAAGDHLFVGGT